jgi:UDP-glucuronate decarboxylase
VSYATQYGVEVRIVRIFNTYGPRMHENDGRVVSNFIVSALANRPLTLYGTGAQTRSFCYVDDLIDGLLRMMDTPTEITGPINLGNPVETSMRALAERVIALTASRSQLTYQALPADDPLQRCPDIARARSLLHWTPAVALDDGLRATIAYFRSRMPSIATEVAVHT